MEILILTGMSGSGKSVAINSLEDIGYFCMDNLPPQLLGDIVIKLASANDGEGIGYDRLACVVDSRSAGFFATLDDSLKQLDLAGLKYKILFLDASDETLIRRYKESRRNHPMAGKSSVLAGLEKERKLLSPLLSRANYIISTDKDSAKSLANKIFHLVEQGGKDTDRLSIIAQSFGFKYGIPEDADLVLDVRFLPNPFYIEELRQFSGQDDPIAEYVSSFPETQVFLNKQIDLLLYLLPYYVREGKFTLNIAIGCTGGRHRSVYLTQQIADQLKAHEYRVTVVHRDIAKDLQK